MNIKETIQNTCWEKFNIEELNQHEGINRQILLNAYHIWIWKQRNKPSKAKRLQEINNQLLNIQQLV